jgi:hypothetical protein
VPIFDRLEFGLLNEEGLLSLLRGRVIIIDDLNFYAKPRYLLLKIYLSGRADTQIRSSGFLDCSKSKINSSILIRADLVHAIPWFHNIL